jgi:3-oxoacyl-[acyl-carrier-protein] synthase II
VRRVVITGMGCVTPIGIGREQFWRALTVGESGVRRIESFNLPDDAPVKIAAEVRGFDWRSPPRAKPSMMLAFNPVI